MTPQWNLKNPITVVNQLYEIHILLVFTYQSNMCKKIYHSMRFLWKGDVKRGMVIFCGIVIKIENNTTLCPQIAGIMVLFQHTLLIALTINDNHHLASLNQLNVGYSALLFLLLKLEISKSEIIKSEFYIKHCNN